MPLNVSLSRLLPSINNIIFDLGGVVINIDYPRTQQAFEALGIDRFGEIYSQAAQTGVFDKFETGRISSDEFRNALRKTLADIVVSDKAFDEAWNAMLLDFPTARLETLAKLQQRFRIFLLSNTNEIHLRSFEQRLFDTIGINSLSGYFERCYYSHECHLRKPDAEVFQLVLSENGLKPEETLFFDDTIRHVESARKLGMHALHVGGDISVEELYETLNCWVNG